MKRGRQKVVELPELKEILSGARMKKWTIVFTNGCFDLVHIGHLRYLEEARSLGDMLVVGLNSDDSVRMLKGNTRPIMTQIERAELLGGLACVDYVIVFSELRPDSLLAEVRPDIHVKGGDYRLEDLPEATVVRSYGGKIALLPFTQGFSTSAIINRIRCERNK